MFLRKNVIKNLHFSNWKKYLIYCKKKKPAGSNIKV